MVFDLRNNFKSRYLHRHYSYNGDIQVRTLLVVCIKPVGVFHINFLPSLQLHKVVFLHLIRKVHISSARTDISSIVMWRFQTVSINDGKVLSNILYKLFRVRDAHTKVGCLHALIFRRHPTVRNPNDLPDDNWWQVIICCLPCHVVQFDLCYNLLYRIFRIKDQHSIKWRYAEAEGIVNY